MSARSRIRRIAVPAVIAMVVSTTALVWPAAPSGAAGMTTHGWMGVTAIDLVESPQLKALLRANREQVRAGAHFPDSGYIPGQPYGEEAHWQRFQNAYADVIMAKDCGDITAPTGPCAAETAHLMGMIAHGTGDEVFDWLFEPNSPDRDEYYLPEELAAVQNEGGQETVMDLVAIGVYGRTGGPMPPLPSIPDLITAFDAAGLPGVTSDQLTLGQNFIGLVHQVEAGWAEDHLPALLEAMPWMSANLVTAPGGVNFAAKSIAGQWESMWGRLLGDQPPTAVTNTYPADGERRIPTGWVRSSYLPGSHRDRGGARTRIMASLNYALPFNVPGEPPTSSTQLPPGAMTLTERDTGAALPIMAGFPRAVPYGADAGEHQIAIQPAVDLHPCTWYRVSVTANLIDHDGNPVVPYSWTFRTGADAAGTRCSGDTYNRDDHQAFVRDVYRDVLGRDVDTASLVFWAGGLTDGAMTRSQFSTIAVDSADHRRHLVDTTFRAYLGRAANADEQMLWGERLKTQRHWQVRAQILGLPEFAAAGSNVAFVRRLFQPVLWRAPSASELSHWTGRLASGVSRAQVAQELVATPEAFRLATIVITYSLLGRVPTAAELTQWAGVIAYGDERVVTRHIISTAEYIDHAPPL